MAVRVGVGVCVRVGVEVRVLVAVLVEVRVGVVVARSTSGSTAGNRSWAKMESMKTEKRPHLSSVFCTPQAQ